MIYDLTKQGGWRADMPVEAVAGFMDLVDLWPGDILKVRSGSGQDGSIHLTGTGEFILRDAKGRELGRGHRPQG